MVVRYCGTGSVRSQTGMEEIHGFQVYVRGVEPSGLRNVMRVGINLPVRISHATVMPGDVAVSDPEGIAFILPQLCKQAGDRARSLT